jgi:hypothetical protein
VSSSIGNSEYRPGLPVRLGHRWILIGIILVAFGFRLWGIERDLPFSPQVDEPERVVRAIRIATTGNLDPDYFNHPSSTVIYPLSAIYHVWNTLFYQGNFLRANPELRENFSLNLGEFYLLGRLLTVGFTILSVPLVYQVGRKAFNTQVGIIAASWWMLFPEVAYYSQVVRDDMAAAFFGVLSLWFCLKLFEQPKIAVHIMAGISIGLAIATRYFMAALIPVLIAVDILILWQRGARHKKTWLGINIGLLSIPFAFLVSTPYFILNFTKVLADVSSETRTVQLGADGLPPPGNFLWYLATGIPTSMTTFFAILVVIGIVLILFRHIGQQMLLLGFALIFLVEISLPSLHWSRWLIQILPVLALFAAEALNSFVLGMSTFIRWTPFKKWTPFKLHVTLVLFTCLASAQPLYQLTLQARHLSNPSTNVLAREWVFQNLPEGAKVAQDAYSAYLIDGDHFVVGEAPTLVEAGYTLDEAYYAGYRYLVIRMDKYSQYQANPDYYPAELNLYQALFNKASLLQEFKASDRVRGPTIRVYELQAP